MTDSTYPRSPYDTTIPLLAPGSESAPSYSRVHEATQTSNLSPYLTSQALQSAQYTNGSGPSSISNAGNPSTPPFLQSGQPSPTLVQLGASRNYLTNNQPAPYIQVLDVDPQYHASRTPSRSKTSGVRRPFHYVASAFKTLSADFCTEQLCFASTSVSQQTSRTIERYTSVNEQLENSCAAWCKSMTLRPRVAEKSKEL